MVVKEGFIPPFLFSFFVKRQEKDKKLLNMQIRQGLG